MCGIIGVVSRGRSDQHVDLAAALDTIALRGPDDCGTWQDEHVALGHRRLSVIGVSHGHQPISSPDGKITIVVNGEFYNHKSIKQELSSTYCFQTASDSELLIPLYQQYGYLGMMQHLRGEFAFILYDKSKGLVVAGRDRFGIKPLCWYSDGNQLIIASKTGHSSRASGRWNPGTCSWHRQPAR